MAEYNLVQVVFDRSALTLDEDVCVITMHIRQTVEAAPDLLPVTDQGRADFVQRLDNWWGTIDSLVASGIHLKEYRFYDVPPAAGGLMGDPVLVHNVGLAGTSTGLLLPPQIAVSVTFKTDKRLQWGRYYMPGPTSSHLAAGGRLDSSYATLMMSAAQLLTDRSGTGACLTVFSRKQWTHHDPQIIQVDDIYDVIRSRRYESPTFRQQLPAG